MTRHPLPSSLEAHNRIPAANRPAIPAANRPRTNFDEASRRIVEHGAGLGSERFPISQLRLEGDRVITGDRELRLDGDGLRRLCGHLHAPVDYLQRLSPKLRNDLLA